MACVCEKKDRRYWFVLHGWRKKAFASGNPNGRKVLSEYSEVGCNKCGKLWRTKAKYVESLNDGGFMLSVPDRIYSGNAK